MRERESAWETISRRIFCVEEKNYSLSREQQIEEEIEEEEEDGKEKEKKPFSKFCPISIARDAKQVRKSGVGRWSIVA